MYIIKYKPKTVEAKLKWDEKRKENPRIFAQDENGWMISKWNISGAPVEWKSEEDAKKHIKMANGDHEYKIVKIKEWA
jgi:hypothetical protein